MFSARIGGLLSVCTAVFLITFALPAGAAPSGVVRISDDPFTAATAPTGQHRTEVEPDTFAFGSTVVSAFQVGRIANGGASDVGFAVSHDGGHSWAHGFLPAATTASTPPGPFVGGSDASVAFDLRHHTWLISWLGLHELGGGIVDVVASRSTDGGRTWSAPVAVAATGTFFDKNWTACDNTPTSPFFGHCYTEFDNAGQRDLEQMSTSADGGLTWSAPAATADAVHGLGGQPVVQPNGRVVVPFEGITRPGGIRSFTSEDGGATWNASVLIATISTHEVAGDIRTSSLPSAEVSRDGTVYVVWQDNRFEPDGAANDIVLSTSDDGTTWSAVGRIPIDPVGSDVDHFIPGLAVDDTSAGHGTLLALTYYFYPTADCTAATCQLEVGFTSSRDAGRHWANPHTLAGPMQLDWLADTTQGVMVGDYISTSLLAGQHRAVPVFAEATPPAGAVFDEPMAAARQTVRGGHIPMLNDPVLFTGGSPPVDPDVAPATGPTAF
ncbi:MAG TPA: sialidase family protein [Pseudonocardiaceae bacterium]|nr:sialidase family protein [Pseudonocardiaceae bacterium]